MDKVTEAKATEATANAGGEQATAEMPPVDQLASTNERLLAESKKNREAYLKTKAELDELRKTQLQEQGKYKELYEKTAADLKTLRQTQMRKDIEGAVKAYAERAGMVKPDLALKLGNAELLAYDETTGQVSGVDSFVDSLKRDVPEMFSTQKTPVINPVTPNGIHKQTIKSPKEMSEAEIIAQLRALGK